MRQIGWVEEGRFLAHRSPSRSEDETEIRADKPTKEPAEQVIKGIRRATRRREKQFFLAGQRFAEPLQGVISGAS